MTNKNEGSTEAGWDRGWDEHKKRQLVRMSRLSMAQKLQWLEDMQRLFEKISQKKASSGSADLTRKM